MEAIWGNTCLSGDREMVEHSDIKVPCWVLSLYPYKQIHLPPFSPALFLRKCILMGGNDRLQRALSLLWVCSVEGRGQWVHGRRMRLITLHLSWPDSGSLTASVFHGWEPVDRRLFPRMTALFGMQQLCPPFDLLSSRPSG